MPASVGQITHNIRAGVPIAKNQIDKISGVHKFGYNPTVGTSYETIWTEGGTYVFPTNATTAVCTSASGATDSGVEITIEGLDANYVEISETLTLNASGTVTSSNSYLRMNRAFVSGSSATDGNITVTVDSLTVAVIDSAYQQTQQLIYTVPAERDGYILQVDAGVQKNQEIILNMNIREVGKVFRTQAIISSFGVPASRAFDLPMHLPPKTDIRVDVKAGASTGVSGELEIILDAN
jgi:hypothetical protein